MDRIANRTEIEKRIDILEDDIAELDPRILRKLLQDKTTKKNILWATKDYESYGPQYDEHAEMKVELITGEFFNVIQPRAAKSKEIQEKRIKKRAEVFTPSWICNEQNNQVDEAWVGRPNVFNTPNGNAWTTTAGKIEFDGEKMTWKKYVDAKRLEITCGEAPYIASRYDTTTGGLIPINDRIGLFDRKMRIVNENCEDGEAWLKWSFRALRSVYGYEFQGDSILIARENILYDYMDYFEAKFQRKASIELLEKVSNIIAWNIWQMDGLRCVVPYSCHETKEENNQISLFEASEQEEKIVQCPGCKKNDIFAHNGIYCRIYDWTNLNKSIPFIDVLREGACHGKI